MSRLQHRLLPLFLAAAAVAPCIAQPPATPQITGRVTRADTGAPIAGATVVISPPFYSGAFVPPTTTTDQSGEYSFLTVNIGKSVFISATADGYTWADYNRDGTPPGLTQNMDASTHFTGIDFQLTPEAVIRGSVKTEDGHPAAGIPVAAFRQPQTPQGKPIYATKTYTEADGSFAIRKLSTGTFTVVVNGPNEPLGYAPKGMAYRQKWYGNQPTAENAIYFAIKEGGERNGVEIAVEPETLYHVTVLPEVPEAQKAAGDYFWVTIKGRNTVGSGYSFSYIPAGHYTLVTDVLLGGMGGKRLGRQETDFDITNADITLHVTVNKLAPAPAPATAP